MADDFPTMPDPEFDDVHVLPFEAPALPPAPPPIVSAEELERLVLSLQEISGPDVGMSSWLSGSDFPPVADSYSHVGGQLLGGPFFDGYELKRHPAVTRLVEHGAAALPTLLHHLTDATPTDLTQQGGMGAWYATELIANPACAREQQALAGAGLPLRPRPALPPPSDDVREHTITIGDACFVILGMITNRCYQAVRYQATMCTVFNSPIARPNLAVAIRQMWTVPDFRQALYDRLLIDYHTRGHYGRFQSGAAMRLLYYFPQETADLIAKRIGALDVRKTRGYREDYEKNGGVGTEDFLKAVSFSDRPAIKDALLHVIKRTVDPRVLLACLNGHDGRNGSGYGLSTNGTRVESRPRAQTSCPRRTFPDPAGSVATVPRAMASAVQAVRLASITYLSPIVHLYARPEAQPVGALGRRGVEASAR
jgi:hypothetical protein